MAQKIKVSTIGAAPLEVCTDRKPEEILTQMFEYLQGKFEQVLPDKPDVIVLPELCDTPENLPTDKLFEYYDCRKDRILDFFSEKAKSHNCYIFYGTARQIPDGTYRNSCVVLDRKGATAGIYDKNHVMISETEDTNIHCGNNANLIECDFGKVGCAICFDINFDQLRMQYVKAKPDLIVFPSMFHGGLAQAFWAYSCRCHFVSAVGIPELLSQIRNPHGTVIASSTNYFDHVTATINLDCSLVHLDFNLEKLTALKAKYGTDVEISDPGEIGSVLVTSDIDNITIQKMLNEFKIEPLDDYLERSLDHHNNNKGK